MNTDISQMERLVMDLLFSATAILVVFLFYRNYQLEKRWCCLRYCWQSMSDFAAERLKVEEDVDEQWLAASKEQISFMSRFGIKPLKTVDIKTYELALLERNMPILVEHKVF